MSLAAELLVRLTARQTGANDFGGPDFNPTLQALVQLADGVAAGQADLLFVDERSVNASSNDDIDLAGVLQSAFGQTITNAELVAILLINAPKAGAANVSDLTLGGGSNPFLGFLAGTTPSVTPIKPGGIFLLACPGAAGIGTVTAGTGDILRVANGAGGTAKYQIAIVGRTA